MDRVGYYEQRESTAVPPLLPNYHLHTEIPRDNLAVQRTLLVDRIFRLSFLFKALDSTSFAAVRLFDRCMGDMEPPFIVTNMSLMAVACFDIIFKYNDHEEYVIQKDRYGEPQSIMETFYKQGFASRENEYKLSLRDFAELLRKVEVSILETSDGQPYSPTPQDYLIECFYKQWDDHTKKKASMLISALCYMSCVTTYSSKTIAATVARLLNTSLTGSPLMCHCDAAQLSLKMTGGVDVLFGAERESLLFFLYHDIYEEWKNVRVV